MPALPTTQHIDVLHVVIARESCRAFHNLTIPVLIALRGSLGFSHGGFSHGDISCGPMPVVELTA